MTAWDKRNDHPYITNGASSEGCLNAGLVCSIDPMTGKCTECGQEEFPTDELTKESK
jgi:hypothetical protein